MTFPETTVNFTCHAHFPTQKHMTFTGHFLHISEISHVMYISQLKNMWHLLDISFTYQKLHMSCTFPNSRTCDIYWTFPSHIRNFTCHVHFPTLNMWHLLDISCVCHVHFPAPDHVTFSGHFLCISQVMYISWLQHLVDISCAYQKFHMSCTFPN